MMRNNSFLDQSVDATALLILSLELLKQSPGSSCFEISSFVYLKNGLAKILLNRIGKTECMRIDFSKLCGYLFS